MNFCSVEGDPDSATNVVNASDVKQVLGQSGANARERLLRRARNDRGTAEAKR